MADNAEVVQETQEEQQPDISTQLQGAIWGDEPIAPTATTEVVEEVKPPADEILDPKEWVKREYEVDDPEVLKQYLKEYKELKAKPPSEELKFANDDSKRFFDYMKEGKEDDLYSYLSKKKTIEKLIGSEVDEKNAADILKFAYKSKNSEYTDADVERKFNRQFGIPKEPVYNEFKETEEEFKERHEEWNAKVQDIKADLVLEAKEAKAELTKLKTELVLPDISKNNSETQRQPSPEDLAAFGKQKESFLQATDLFLKDFSGFSANVKDKDVDYNVGYAASQEEKQMAVQIAKEFAESGFDANALFVKSWLNQDGTLNVKQLIEDKMLLANREKVFQKIANDAANQRLELYLMGKKNIRIDTGAGKDFGAGDQDKNTSEKLQESFWGS